MTTYSVYSATVESAWIDHNGHMNVAYYTKVFDDALEATLDQLGFGEAYRASENKSFFVVEAHITYEREADEGENLEVKTKVIGFDTKRLALFHEMLSADKGHVSATQEVLMVHIDQAARRSAEINAAHQESLQDAVTLSLTDGYPEKAGRQLKPLLNQF